MSSRTVPDHPSAVSGILRRPFREQVAYFRGKLGNLVPTERWDDIQREEHDTAFMVAGAQKADLLADLAAAVDRAITEGKSLEAFRQDFNAAVARNDWHGWTGEDSKSGRAWRTRTIYRTNASVSYAAGRYAQLQSGDFLYWVYRHGGSKHPRLEHLSWNGLVLASDDPAWGWLYPPSDWGCSCYVLGARTLAGARRLGGKPDMTRPENFGKIDPQTGTPEGVGQGWDYAPGARVAAVVQTTAEKVRQWDYQLAKAYMASLPDDTRDALAQAYRRLPSVAADARRYARRVLGDGGEATIQPNWTLGVATSQQASEIAQLKAVDVAGFDFSLAPSDILHVRAKHGTPAEVKRGQVPVTAADYARLPGIISHPDAQVDAGATDIGEPLVRFEKVIGRNRYVATFAIRAKRKTLGLKTFYIVAGK